MFAFDWTKGGPWNSQGIKGPQRFLDDVWRLVIDPAADGLSDAEPDFKAVRALRRKTHQTIEATTRDMENFSFNTYLAALMSFRNVLQDAKRTPLYGSPAWEEAIETLLLLMAPATPHIAEELWSQIGRPYSIHQQSWPVFDPELAAEDEITLVVQVNGNVRERFTAPADIEAAEAIAQAKTMEGVTRYLDDKQIVKEIYIPGKLVNLVVK
jgi:leucyl-tRNA synthetase